MQGSARRGECFSQTSKTKFSSSRDCSLGSSLKFQHRTCELPRPVYRPRDRLTARRVRDGVGACLICQPDARPAIKSRRPPAAFPTSLCVPASSFTLLHGPVIPQASASSTLPCRPLFPTEGYDAASENTASARPPALIRSTSPFSRAGLSRRRLSVGLPLTMTLMQCPGVSSHRRRDHTAV